MRVRRSPLAGLAAACVLAAPAAAQEPQAPDACQVVETRRTEQRVTGGLVTVFVSGPLFVRCTGGEELRADSAVIYRNDNEVHLFRNVDYLDRARSLTSDRATYAARTGRLHATGNVVFTDRERGSTLRGPELEYFRAMEGRPEAQTVAPGRPHLTVVPETEPGEAPRAPMEIDADRITTVGQRLVTATGRVLVEGDELDARASEAFWDADAERLELRRDASVAGEEFTLTGDFIDARLPGGSPETVYARGAASLTGDRLQVDAPEMRLFFEDDLLQRLAAGLGRSGRASTAAARAPAPPPPGALPADGGAPPPPKPAAPPLAGRPVTPAAEPGPAKPPQPAGTPAAGPARVETPAAPPAQRAVALSDGFRLEADSLEALLPGQRVERVTAIGDAVAESWDTAQVAAEEPPSTIVPDAVDVDSAAVPSLAPGGVDAAAASLATTGAPSGVPQRDLLFADTIIGFFTERRLASADSLAAAADTASVDGEAVGDTAEVELERMLALGSARSLYRMRDEGDPAGRPGVNYVTGDTIELRMKQGEIDVATVRGLKHGLYLDPREPSRPAADSAAVPGGAREQAPPLRPAPTPSPAPPGPSSPTPAAPPRPGERR